MDNFLNLLNQRKFLSFEKKMETPVFTRLPQQTQTFLKALFLVRTEDAACLEYIPQNFSFLSVPHQSQVLLEFADYLSRLVSYSAAQPIFDQLTTQQPQNSEVFETYVRHLLRHEYFDAVMATISSRGNLLPVKQKDQFLVAALDGAGESTQALAHLSKTEHPSVETLAILTAHAGRYEEAARLFSEMGDKLSENAAYEYSLVLLKLRQYELAWRYYQARPIHSPHSRLIMRMNWKAPEEPLSADQSPPIFIWEQGLGDQLIFIRYAKCYRTITGRKLRVFLEDRLRALLAHEEYQGFQDIEFLESLPDGAGNEQYFGLASLPYYLQRLGHEPVDCANSTPPQYFDMAARASWQKIGQSSGLIGVAWKSSSPKGSALKSVSLECLLKMIPPEKKLVNLNFEPETSGDIDRLGATDRFGQSCPPDRARLHEVYRTLQRCEGYVGLSNTYVHLGQLFGLPSVVHIPHVRNEIWYWAMTLKMPADMFDWYSAVTLYRHY